MAGAKEDEIELQTITSYGYASIITNEDKNVNGSMLKYLNGKTQNGDGGGERG